MYEKTAVIFRVPAHNDIAGQKRELMRGDMEKMGIIKTMARAVPALAAAAALTLGASAAELVPVGEAVGIEVQTEGMLVAGLTAVETAGGEELCPAADCGVEPGDIITRLGSREVLTAEDFAAAAAELDGGEVSLTLQRGGKTIQYSIAPVRAASGEWRLGLLLRDGMSGIGTVTYYDPATGSYGALGHSINDPASGSELPLGGGVITEAQVAGVLPGRAGQAGELHGVFDVEAQLGSVLLNTQQGIFGRTSAWAGRQAVPAAEPGQIADGPAKILANVSGDEVREFAVNVEKSGDKLLVTVTDPELLSITGGIVQGMSGCPILQEGRLIGAVTHVLVNDPARGYGIPIYSMLAAAESIEQRDAA